MPYNLQLPNGQTIAVDDDVPLEKARLMIVREYPDLFKRPQGFGPAMGAGWDRAMGAIEGFGADVADKAGLPKGAGDWLRKQAEQNKQQAQQGYDPTTSEDVSSAFDRQGVMSGIGALSRRYLTEPAGGMAGSLGPAAMGAAAGAVSPIPGGATLGFAAPYFAQSAGENQERQREANPGVQPDMLKSTATALAQTVLGTFGFGKMVHGALGSQLAMREATKLAPKVLTGEITKDAAVAQLGGTLRNVLAETAANAGINIGTGAADEALRRAQAGQPLGDENAIDTYKDIARTGAVLAPIFGALHGTGARGRAESFVSDAARQGEASRRAIQAEQQAGVAESLQPPEAPEPVVQTPEQAKAAIEAQQQLESAKTYDAASRAVDMRDQAGVLNPQRPLEMVDTNGMQRRADAQAAFEQAQMQPDLFAGEMAVPKPPEEGVPMRRAADVPEPAPVGQGELPLDAITRRDQFSDMVYPNSPTYRNGRLDGHDLNTLKGVQDLTAVLKKYMTNVEDSERNAPRRAALEARISDLEALRDEMKAQAKEASNVSAEPVVAADARAAADRAVNPVEPVAAPAVTGKLPLTKGEPHAPDESRADRGPTVEDMGQRGEQQAVPAGLPDTERSAVGSGAEDAAGRVRPEAVHERALKDSSLDAAMADAGLTPYEIRKMRERPDETKLRQIDEGYAYHGGDFRKITPEDFYSARDAAEQAAAKKIEDSKQIEQAVADEDYGKLNKVLGSDWNSGMNGVPLDQAALSALDAKYSYALNLPDRLERILKRAGEDVGDALLKARTNDALGQAVKAGDFQGVASALAGSKNPLISHIGEQAAKLHDVNILSDKGNAMLKAAHPGEKVKADYRAATKTAVISPTATKSEHTVAHELVHALTLDAIDNPSKEQKYFVDKIDKLYQHVKKLLDGYQDYGLTDLHEFVSEAMTNGRFQRKLAKIRYQNTTAWGKFTEFVAKLLGLKNDNAFTEFLANYEGLEKAQNGEPAAPSTKILKLGDYPLSATHELRKGSLGSKVNDALDTVRGGGLRAQASSFKDKMVQELFNSQHGIMRHLERAWTRATPTGTEATARALLQASTYAPQLARESLSLGYVVKNAEGFWKIKRSDANLRSFLESVNSLPTDKDKFQVANGIITNLAYHEREQLLGQKKAGAQHLLDEAEREFDEARKLKGARAASAWRRAKAKKDMAEDLLDTEYKRPPSVTDETIAQALQDAKTPEVKKMLDVVREMNRQDIDMWKEGGNISAETADLWKQREHYVPLQRMMGDDEGTVGMLLRAQGGARTRDIKAFKGSEREVNDITENIIRQRMFAVDSAMRNNAAKKAMEELVAEPGNPAGITELGNKAPTGMRNVVSIKIDGEKNYFKVDDPLTYESFRGIVEEAPGFVNALEHVTKFFREAVMLSPDAMLRNMVRDATEVWNYGASDKSLLGVYSSIFGRFGKSLPGVMREGFGSKIHQPHYAVAEFGITGQKEFTSLDAERMSIVREQISKNGMRDWGATADGIIGGMAKLMKPLQNMAAEGELASRQHVFEQVYKRSGSETEAAMAAINTLDFRRRGASQAVSVAKKLIPFFNSTLQGWYKIASALAGDNLSSGFKDRKQAMRALRIKAAKMVAVAWLYQTYMQQDDDFMEVKKDIRDTSVLIPIDVDEHGKKVFMRMPLPFEFGTAFWTIPANVAELFASKQSGAEFKKAMTASIMRAMPGMGPQAIKPLIENTANYSFFSDRPLENDAVANLAPGQRSYSTTSEVAKDLGEAMNYSPIKIDNFLRGYLGSLGVVAVQLTDAALAAGEKPETAWHRAPVLRSIMTDPMSSSSRDRFYDLKERVTQVRNTAMSLAKSKPEEARAYLAKETDGVPNKVLFDMYRGVGQLDNILRNASRAEKAIRDSKDTPAMKRARLEQLRNATNAMLKKAMPGLRTLQGIGEEESPAEDTVEQEEE